jgi:hypothetical protein
LTHNTRGALVQTSSYGRINHDIRRNTALSLQRAAVKSCCLNIVSRHEMPRLILGLLICTCIVACGYHGGSARGRVLEVQNPSSHPSEWTKRPVADADVTVFWYGGVLDNTVHVSSVCLGHATGKTDNQGWYDVPGWWRRPKLKPIARVRTVAHVYKEGYTFIPHEAGLDRVWRAEPGLHLMQMASVSATDSSAQDVAALLVELCSRTVP